MWSCEAALRSSPCLELEGGFVTTPDQSRAVVWMAKLRASKSRRLMRQGSRSSITFVPERIKLGCMGRLKYFTLE
jgi:hypothetical protein